MLIQSMHQTMAILHRQTHLTGLAELMAKGASTDRLMRKYLAQKVSRICDLKFRSAGRGP